MLILPGKHFLTHRISVYYNHYLLFMFASRRAANQTVAYGSPKAKEKDSKCCVLPEKEFIFMISLTSHCEFKCGNFQAGKTISINRSWKCTFKSFRYLFSLKKKKNPKQTLGLNTQRVLIDPGISLEVPCRGKQPLPRFCDLSFSSLLYLSVLRDRRQKDSKWDREGCQWRYKGELGIGGEGPGSK